MRDVSWWLIIALAVAVAATISWLFGKWWSSDRAPGHRPHFTHAAQLAVVVNPIKVANLAAERQWLTSRCEAAGWAPPLWYETTLDDPGYGVTKQALAAGVDVVMSYGGDGTARSVAAALVNTGVPLALLPAGTGNLLSRNVGIPIADKDAAVAVALGPGRRRLDIGQLEINVTGEDDSPRREAFLVMAGLGFDADVMALATSKLKQRMGWLAYVVAGLRLLSGQRTHVTIRFDDREPIHRKVRSVLVGNCGELTAGVRLLPVASPDDGVLDVAVVSPRSILGWAGLSAGVLARVTRNHPVVEYFQCSTVEVFADSPMRFQVDGDSAGRARQIKASCDPASVIICRQ